MRKSLQIKQTHLSENTLKIMQNNFGLGCMTMLSFKQAAILRWHPQSSASMVLRDLIHFKLPIQIVKSEIWCTLGAKMQGFFFYRDHNC